MNAPIIKAFHDGATGSWQYIFHDPRTRAAAIVDPVLDYDPNAGATGTRRADEILAYVEAEKLDVVWILDTHPHADHFSAAPYLKKRTGAKTAIGEKVVEVQKLWKTIYHLPASFPTDGSQWDRLLADGERIMVGDIPVDVLFTPGHTLASVAYVAGDAAFVHDTLMMPDSGSSRADFPGGDAGALHESITRILALPDSTRIFVGHDYAPGERAPLCESTVKDQRETNIHIRDGFARADYVALREARDATLPLPKLMLAALQVNIRGGRLPEAEENGERYLKIPLNQFEGKVPE
jgi:glyoxylase-like metal-dependent hydrolase (beta-lactamase superfamily II)